MKRLEPFQHLRPRNTGDRPPLEPRQNIVLIVVQVDGERPQFPVPPVLREHLIGNWTHPGKVEAPYTVCIAFASNSTGLVKSSVECRRIGL